MKRVLKNKPTLQLILSAILFAFSCIKITTLTYLFGVLLIISLVLFLTADNHVVLTIDNSELTLYSADGLNSDTISLDKITYWQIAEIGGNLTMVFADENKQEKYCTISTNNTLGLSIIFNHYLKDKNYKLKKLNSPYEAVGKVIRKEK